MWAGKIGTNFTMGRACRRVCGEEIATLPPEGLKRKLDTKHGEMDDAREPRKMDDAREPSLGASTMTLIRLFPAWLPIH